MKKETKHFQVYLVCVSDEQVEERGWTKKKQQQPANKINNSSAIRENCSPPGHYINFMQSATLLNDLMWQFQLKPMTDFCFVVVGFFCMCVGFTFGGTWRIVTKHMLNIVCCLCGFDVYACVCMWCIYFDEFTIISILLFVENFHNLCIAMDTDPNASPNVSH